MGESVQRIRERSIKSWMRRGLICLLLACAFLFTSACTGDAGTSPGVSTPPGQTDLPPEETPGKQPGRDNTPQVLLPTASTGTDVFENEYVRLDYGNRAKGYVIATYKGSDPAGKKLQIAKWSDSTNEYSESVGYSLDCLPGEDVVVALTQGNGKYYIRLYERDEENHVVTLGGKEVSVTLEDAFLPFLYPSKMVHFAAEDEAIALSKKLADDAGAKNEYDVAVAIYKYVIRNIGYDKNRKAEQGGTLKWYYVDIDKVVAERKGICYDYAVLTTAMLRAQGIPTRMIIGRVNENSEVTHAWIEIWSETTQTWNNVLRLRAGEYTLNDPTHAAAGTSATELVDRIGDGEHYFQLYVY
ncbi:transglutaminase domain-containing protein [Eubacteriales bacterium OttesenSCG-928-M02]|nr:transglutaminase domain-containing protein [Eubacteriales bacterium OttesenSCG-928-M02]